MCTVGKVTGLALPCVQAINEGQWWVWQRQQQRHSEPSPSGRQHFLDLVVEGRGRGKFVCYVLDVVITVVCALLLFKSNLPLPSKI